MRPNPSFNPRPATAGVVSRAAPVVLSSQSRLTPPASAVGVNSNVRHHQRIPLCPRQRARFQRQSTLIMARQLHPTTLRRLERCLLWLTVPSLALSALVALALATGTANVHGGSGYALLLLVPLVPIGLIATVVLLPLLIAQYRKAPDEYSSPLARAALTISVIYVGFCVLVAWQAWPQIVGHQ